MAYHQIQYYQKDKIQIKRLIGTGGFGEVHEAYHKDLMIKVVVKKLLDKKPAPAAVDDDSGLEFASNTG